MAALGLASCVTTSDDQWLDQWRQNNPKAWAPPSAPTAEQLAPAEAPAPDTTPPGEERPAAAPLKLTVLDAVFLALENNQSLAVEKLNPDIQRTFVEQEAGVFDPILEGSLSRSRTRSNRADQIARANGAATTGTATTDTIAGDVGVSAFLPTGTDVSVDASAQRDYSNSRTAGSSHINESRIGLSVTQSLLRGFGTRVNLVSLRQARLDVLTSQYELRGFAEALIANVEQTYWDYALYKRQIEIYTDSLKLAQQQEQETEERIHVGKLAEIELAAAQAEVALRRENLINARSRLATARLQLLRLLSAPGKTQWDREIVLEEEPSVPKIDLGSVEDHVHLADLMRPDVNQARLALPRGDLELVKTRNGLLPKMDLFINLGKSGYAESFGTSVSNIDGNSYDAAVGVNMSYPLGNRDADARNRRARLSRQQVADALTNLEQLASLDVRSAYIEVERQAAQVTATAATRHFQEEALRAEIEKFRVGKSTTFLVAQAQRDLVVSQIGEVEAIVNYRKALIALYRLEGSLLARYPVDAPGAAPPAPPGEEPAQIPARPDLKERTP